jgi:LysM repeat protein
MCSLPTIGRGKIKKRNDTDLQKAWKMEPTPCSTRISIGIGAHGRICVFRRFGALFVFAVLLFLFGCSNGDHAEELDAIKTRLDMIEERLIQLEKTTQRISPLEFQLNGLQESVTELGRIIAATPDASTAAEKEMGSQNKARYHEVRRGDTLYGIAQEYGISVPTLIKLNNLSKKQAIYPGQRLLIKPGSAE